MLPGLIRIATVSTTLLFGLMAGFFATYSFNVSYATLALNGETYAIVQSLFNINVRHFGFFLCFFGAGVMPIVTGILQLLARQRTGVVWLVLGIGYALGIIFFTQSVNLPLNYYTESWNPVDVPADWQDVRAAWNQANLFRTWLSLALFAVSVWLLTGPPVNDSYRGRAAS